MEDLKELIENNLVKISSNFELIRRGV